MARIIRSFFAAFFGGLLFSQSLTIYTELSPPDQFLGPDGKLTGYAYEVVREIQKRTGSRDPIEVVPWVRGYKELQGKPNVALFSVARSEDRDPLFLWVGPLREASFDFYVRKDAPISIRSLDDARKLESVGVYREDIRDQLLTKLGFTNLDRSIDNVTAMKKLMSGRIGCFAAMDRGIDEIAVAAGYKPDEVRKAFTFLQMQLYIAFSKSTARPTVKAWARALDGMRKDGTFEHLFRKYFPNAPLPDLAVTTF
jgi:polar amino acid transport system substrate-binding protein